VAADTFNYIGDLDDAFRLAGQALTDGGLLAFSVEDCDRSPMKKAAAASTEDDDGFTLVASGRYAHTWRYLENLARQHPFTYCFVQRITVRMETATPIPGYLCILQKTASSSNS
jgi:predicted TPR repeat methyltransferase